MTVQQRRHLQAGLSVGRQRQAALPLHCQQKPWVAASYSSSSSRVVLLLLLLLLLLP
jgi:hypothetical protein